MNAETQRQLLKSCKWTMQALADGVLVRDITHDAEPSWPLRMMEFTRQLAAMQAAIEEAEGEEVQFCAECGEEFSKSYSECEEHAKPRTITAEERKADELAGQADTRRYIEAENREVGA